jgi:RNA polymerase sigma-70 factor (sigma-E family)
MASQTGFDHFMNERQRPLLRFAMVLTGDAGRSEEIVSDVLSKAWERWDRIGAMDQPSAYVRRMIINEYLGWRRRAHRMSPSGDVTQISDASGAATSDHAIDHAERDALITALSRLPRKQRAVLVLRFYAGLTDAEIAEILDCCHGAVRSNISRALAALRIRLHDTDPERPVRAAASLATGDI